MTFICIWYIGIEPASSAEKNRKSQTANSSMKPNFNYPQNVADKAETAYEAYVSNGNGLKALQEAIKISIAKGLISSSNIKESIGRFSMLSSRLDAPYNKIALMLEAQEYLSLYHVNPYQYSRRKLPVGVYPENIEEWSKDMFAAKIDSLLSLATNDLHSLSGYKLTALKGLIESADYKKAEQAGMNVADFVAAGSSQMLSELTDASMIPLRFGDIAGALSPAEQCGVMAMRLLDEGISRNTAVGNIRLASWFSKMKYDRMPESPASRRWLTDCIEAYSDTPYGAWTISEKIEKLLRDIDYTQSPNESRKNALDLANSYIKRFPGAEGITDLKRMAAALEKPTITINHSNQIIADEPWKCEIEAQGIYKFRLLVYRLNDDLYKDRSIELSKILSGGKLAANTEVSLTGTTPETVQTTVQLPALAPGLYVAFPTSNGTPKTIIANDSDPYISVFRVSNLSYFLTDAPEGGCYLYVTKAKTQEPVDGAKVIRTERVYNKPPKTTTYKTDGDGKVLLPSGNAKLRISVKNDCIEGDYYTYSNNSSQSDYSYRGNVLTDLSIYKPGQKLQFTGVVWKTNGHSIQEVGEMKVTATLQDANYQKVDTLELTTDKFGRYNGSFIIPDSGLLGNYQVRVMAGKYDAGQAWVNVAEYKSPTFLVELKGSEGEYKIGDTIRLKGQAETYSGMPVAGGEVKFTINYRQWRHWWYGGISSAECGGTVTTDGEGNFLIELPTANLGGTPYEEGIFILSAAVTNGAGETQEAEPIVFSIGRAYTINASVPARINAEDKNVNISVTVNDMTGTPVDKPVYFAINNGEDRIAAGLYEKESFIKMLLEQPSGSYNVIFSLNDSIPADDSSNSKTDVIIWRKSDIRPPVSTPLWVPENRIITPEGEKKAMITVGTAFDDSYLFMIVSDTRKIIEQKWIKANGVNQKIEINAPEADERIFVTFVGMHDLDRKHEVITLIPAAQTKKINIKSESFRDRLTPGDREQWKFRFDIEGEPLSIRPIMAVMSNKALNALSPFQWSFNPYGSLSWYNQFHVSMRDLYRESDTFTKYKIVKGSSSTPLMVPAWNFYGHSLIGHTRIYNQMMYSMMPTASNLKSRKMALSEDMVMDSAVLEESEIMIRGSRASGVSEDMEEEGAQSEDNIRLRPIEMPLAFFMPDLITDEAGVVDVNFEVPQFIGTWQFQIAGYDEKLRGAVATFDAVASKQVMVQMNAPRFLRTGDKAEISATLFNNSGEIVEMSGKIEIINPVNGKILTSVNPSPRSVPAGGSEVISVTYDVPSDLSFVKIRAYAYGNSHTDGEQAEIAVLPSSTPVLESRAFYAGPGKQTIKVTMPAKGEEANVTLQYCGNPIWECVTALPAIITTNSNNILARINALYGTSIADGLMRKYPALQEAISLFAAPENAADSTLVSNLQKNEDVKLRSLNNTPWVNDAADETARMQALVKYLNREEAEKSITETMKVLVDRQNMDGGWSWCEGMPSSTFITGRVLLHLAMLNGMGYLPQGAEKLAEKAFRFMDKELVDNWKRNNPRTFSVNLLLNYLYIKSFFPEFKDESGFDSLRAEAMKAIAGDWGKFSIYDKATAVTLEWRSGNERIAGEILESLRQYASVSEEKGMWFDNLRGVWSGWNPLIITAQVLEAYNEVRPEDPAVNQLRQWLLMSKQTQSWGDMNATVEVINALLTSGSDWTTPGTEAKVKVKGREVEVPKRAKLTDSFTINLTRAQLKQGNISIEKFSAGPSWGGVVSQYVVPILDVEADAIPQLSIRKEIFAISPAGDVSGDAENLKVGDKVRITLTITCDRDLEYVAVVDSRSACLEPAEQLSGYTSSDGLWYYQETTNEGTNLFIPFIGKGSHVVNYECYVDRAGEYAAGIASAQSQYAPVIAAHSAGLLLKVAQK